MHPDVDYRIMPLVFGIILAPAVITALTEPTILLPPICKPFVKRGLLGRVAGVFMLPGWPSGVFYTTLLLDDQRRGHVVARRDPIHIPIATPKLLVVCLSFVGGVLLPALLAANFSKQESKRFTNFIVFLLVLGHFHHHSRDLRQHERP